jgi:hypothetical protein
MGVAVKKYFRCWPKKERPNSRRRVTVLRRQTKRTRERDGGYGEREGDRREMKGEKLTVWKRDGMR